MATAETVLDAHPDSVAARRSYLALLSQRAELALIRGEYFAAKLISDQAVAGEVFGARGEDRITPATDAARFSLIAADVALAMNAHDDAAQNANAALNFLEEIDGPDDGWAVWRARAYLTLGRAQAGLGDALGANRTWRRGLAALRDGNGHIIENVYRARLSHLIGEEVAAADIRERLARLGYSEPTDDAFWASVGIQTASQRHGETNDG